MASHATAFCLLIGAALVAALGLCAVPHQQVMAQENSAYTLGSGDKVRISIFGEEDLSGEFEVDGTGALSLPLVGEVQAGGLSLRKLETEIEAAYKGDYLLHPKVSAEVMNFRPFFILGEVNEPGHYPYISGMTVLNAVAVAGGYTYRASQSKITLKRNEREAQYVAENTKILPGDVLHVYERFF